MSAWQHAPGRASHSRACRGSGRGRAAVSRRAALHDTLVEEKLQLSVQTRKRPAGKAAWWSGGSQPSGVFSNQTARARQELAEHAQMAAGAHFGGGEQTGQGRMGRWAPLEKKESRNNGGVSCRQDAGEGVVVATFPMACAVQAGSKYLLAAHDDESPCTLGPAVHFPGTGAQTPNANPGTSRYTTGHGQTEHPQ